MTVSLEGIPRPIELAVPHEYVVPKSSPMTMRAALDALFAPYPAIIVVSCVGMDSVETKLMCSRQWRSKRGRTKRGELQKKRRELEGPTGRGVVLTRVHARLRRGSGPR